MSLKFGISGSTLLLKHCHTSLTRLNPGLLTGERTYFLTGALAELEQALVQWTVDRVAGAGFSLVSVPDLLHPAVISACGMAAEGERTQVYHLDPVYGRVALSGTAEMALGGYLAGKVRTELYVLASDYMDLHTEPARVLAAGAAVRGVAVLQGRDWPPGGGARPLQGAPVHQGGVEPVVMSVSTSQ